MELEQEIEALYVDVDQNGHPTEPEKDGCSPVFLLEGVQIGGRPVQIPFAHARQLGFTGVLGRGLHEERSSKRFGQVAHLPEEIRENPVALEAIWRAIRKQVRDIQFPEVESASMTMAQVYAAFAARDIKNPTDESIKRFVSDNGISLM